MPAAAHERSFAIPTDLAAGMRGWRTRFLAAGAGALILSIIGGFFNASQFYRSYLWSYMFFLGLPLGATAMPRSESWKSWPRYLWAKHCSSRKLPPCDPALQP